MRTQTPAARRRIPLGPRFGFCDLFGGCLILVGIDHGEFGTVLRVIDAAFATRPDPADWRDYAAWGTRRSGD